MEDTKTQVVCEKCGKPATHCYIETTVLEQVEVIYGEMWSLDDDGDPCDSIGTPEVVDSESLEDDEVGKREETYLCDECEVD